MRFTPRDYQALHRLRHNADFLTVVQALERRLEARRRDIENLDPDRPGKIGQAQGACRELADILESVHNTEKGMARPG